MAPPINLLDVNGRPLRNGDWHGSDFALPHVLTFTSILSGASHTYWHDRFDEAMRHGRKDALVMENDAYLMALLQERKLSVASLPWHLEVDDENDPTQAACRDGLTKQVKSVPGFQRVCMALLEALWFGRYAVQARYGWKQGAPQKAPEQPQAGTPSPEPSAGVVRTADVSPARPPAPAMLPPRRELCVKHWLPVNGDKLGNRHDGTPYILVHAS